MIVSRDVFKIVITSSSIRKSYANSVFLKNKNLKSEKYWTL